MSRAILLRISGLDIRKKVCLNVKRIRKKTGLRRLLPLKAGFHRTYISGIERGIRNQTVTIVERLAAALDVEPFEFLSVRPVNRKRPVNHTLNHFSSEFL